MKWLLLLLLCSYVQADDHDVSLTDILVPNIQYTSMSEFLPHFYKALHLARINQPLYFNQLSIGAMYYDTINFEVKCYISPRLSLDASYYYNNEKRFAEIFGIPHEKLNLMSFLTFEKSHLNYSFCNINVRYYNF